MFSGSRKRFTKVIGEPIKKSLVHPSTATGHPMISEFTLTGNPSDKQAVTGKQWCFVVAEFADAGTLGKVRVKVTGVPVGLTTTQAGGANSVANWTYVGYRLILVQKGQIVESSQEAFSNASQDTTTVGFGSVRDTTSTRCKGLFDLYPETGLALWSADNGIVQYDPNCPVMYNSEDVINTKRSVKPGAKLILQLCLSRTASVNVMFTAKVISFIRTN